MTLKNLLHWTFILPILSALFYFSGLIDNSLLLKVAGGAFLISSVLSAVHHAEVVAHKVGEPFGTIVLALSITILEVAIIISLMIAGGEGASTYARDTVFAAVMLLLTGIMGICIWIGGMKFREQSFARSSATTSLVSLVAILTITLILPNFTTSQTGPLYTESQLVFVSLASLVIYGTFIGIQTVRHREYFVTEEEEEKHVPSSWGKAILSLVFLLICLGIVVLMAKALSPSIENMVSGMGAPKSLVGVIIAAVVLMPEAISAIRAARRDKIQNSLNLVLGSALASIGLTIPAVSAVCIMFDIPLILGLDAKSIILLGLAVFTVMLSLSRGKTNVLYGTVLLVIMASYIFTIIVP